MTNELAELKDIHLPNAISWWPLAPGWWILLTLILATFFIILLALRYRRLYAWRKSALAELSYIINNKNSNELGAALSELVRRCAIQLQKRSKKPIAIAQLEGKQWSDYLSTVMEKETAEWLAINRYKANSTIDTAMLEQSISTWIKKAKP